MKISENDCILTAKVYSCLFLLILLLAPLTALGLNTESVTETKSSQNSAEVKTKHASDQDKKCLKCHSKDKTKLLEDGEEMSLNLPLSAYTSSAHSKEGCISCHKVIASKKHPAKKYRISIPSQRDYSVERNEVCRDCHQDQYSQYKGSIHASLIKHGSRTAPVCSDCHSAHAVEPMIVYEQATGLPCKQCHDEVYQAYSSSVHGQARNNGNVIREEDIQAPICVDCHSAHDVSAVASKLRIRTLCLECHENAVDAHDQWLPNSTRHLDIISCAACHVPGVERRIDLELHQDMAQAESGQNQGQEALQQQLNSIDAAGNAVNPAEFKDLLNAGGEDGQSADVSLRGRMESRSGIKAHSLANKSLAVRDCESCHEKGSKVFGNVMVSVIGPDGRRLHYPADKEILDSMRSVDSVNDFYTIGGTRIPLLDVLVVLSLIAGLGIPVGHYLLGRLLKRKMAKENNNA